MRFNIQKYLERSILIFIFIYSSHSLRVMFYQGCHAVILVFSPVFMFFWHKIPLLIPLKLQSKMPSGITSLHYWDDPNTNLLHKPKHFSYILIYKNSKFSLCRDGNFLYKNIFLMVFVKSPVFPPSGKMNIQIPFSLIYVDATNLNIKALHKNIYMIAVMMILAS